MTSKGSMTYAFTYGGFFTLSPSPPLSPSPLPNLSIKAQIPALRSKSQPCSPNPILEAQITLGDSRMGFGPRGRDLGLKTGIWVPKLGFGPQGWDLGLKAGIWASRLGFGPQGWDLGLKAGIWALRLRSESEMGMDGGGGKNPQYV